jgi:hypothetical protein
MGKTGKKEICVPISGAFPVFFQGTGKSGGKTTGFPVFGEGIWAKQLNRCLFGK